MSNRTRRQFLEDSMFATATAIAAGGAGSLLAAEKKKKPEPADGGKAAGPNDRLRVAVIGVNGRGQSHISAFLSHKKDVDLVCICDADSKVGQAHCEKVGKETGNTPKFVQDPREVFADPNIDAISTATPNHWHALIAIWAMQAGKDVYVEKPVSHNVSEGRRIVETARKYNKICQAGTQSRSMEGMRQCIEYLHSGKLGEVTFARGLCYKSRPSIGPKGEYEVPATVNADVWYGPAPLVTLTRPKFHYDWHWQWDYGCGDLGNQGIHQMDIARWGLGMNALSNHTIGYGGRFGYEDAGETPNTEVVIHDYGAKALTFEVRGLKTDDYKGAKVGVIFYGTGGHMVCPSYDSASVFDNDGKLVTSFKGGGDHFGNFLSAVRSRKAEELHGEILEGHLSSALCHTGNISYRLGKLMHTGEAIERLKSLPVKNADVAETFDRFVQHLSDNKAAPESVQLGPYLECDPHAETFVGNSAADAMLTRDYRAPYIVPAAGKV